MSVKTPDRVRAAHAVHTYIQVHTLIRDMEAKELKALALAQMYQNESAARGERIAQLKIELVKAQVDLDYYEERATHADTT